MATGTYAWSGGLLKRDTFSNVFRSILYPQQGSHAVVQTVITKGTILAINAATGIISARALHPTARGELSAMILWPVFLSSALSLGVPSSLVFNLKQNHADHKSLLSAAVWMGFILGSLAGLIGAIAMPHLLAQYPRWVVHAAQLFMLTTPAVHAHAGRSCHARNSWRFPRFECCTAVHAVAHARCAHSAGGLRPHDTNLGRDGVHALRHSDLSLDGASSVQDRAS